MVKEDRVHRLQHPIKADGIIAIKINDDDELVFGAPHQWRRDDASWWSLTTATPCASRVRRALDGP